MSAPKRFFVEQIEEGQTEVRLTGEEFTHAKTVLRVSEGTELVLLDGTGKEYRGIVASVGKRELTVHIVGVSEGEKEAKSKVCLLICALKGDKTELVVQKATELGVYEIVVFNSKYCSAYMNDGNKLERLNKVAKESAKQCLRSIPPQVYYCDSFEGALQRVSDYQNKLFACEFATASDRTFASLQAGQSTALVVGSEGGFAEEEFAMAREQYGFSGITLGKRILRAETAAIALTAVTMQALGEWE